MLSFLSRRVHYTTQKMSKCMVFVTAPNQKAAESISEHLVSKELVACVNIVPQVTSVYKWKGEIQKDSEYLLVMKTKQSLVDEISETVKSIHEYDVPEVISTEITGGLSSYLQWIDEVTK